MGSGRTQCGSQANGDHLALQPPRGVPSRGNLRVTHTALQKNSGGHLSRFHHSITRSDGDSLARCPMIPRTQRPWHRPCYWLPMLIMWHSHQGSWREPPTTGRIRDWSSTWPMCSGPDGRKSICKLYRDGASGTFLATTSQSEMWSYSWIKYSIGRTGPKPLSWKQSQGPKASSGPPL